jgi:hypothetical protein
MAAPVAGGGSVGAPPNPYRAVGQAGGSAGATNELATDKLRPEQMEVEPAQRPNLKGRCSKCSIGLGIFFALALIGAIAYYVAK